MTVLTTFSNNGSFKDFRDTFNAMLADIVTLKNAITPVLLPTVGSAPSAIFSAYRMVSGSTPLVLLRRQSDGATQAFGAAPGNWIDASAISSWTNGANPTVVTFYDQTTGNAGPTQSDTGLQPVLDLANIRHGAVMAHPGLQQCLNWTGQALPRRNTSLFFLSWITSSNGAIGGLNNGTDTNIESLGGTPLGSYSSQGGPTSTSLADEIFLRVGMKVIGFTGTSANRTFFTDQTSAAKTANTQDVNASVLRVGGDLGGGFLKGGHAGVVVYPALSQADALKVTAVLQAIGGSSSTYDRRVVALGDSIQYGQGASTTGTNTVSRLSLSGVAEIINIGVSNTKLQDWDSGYNGGGGLDGKRFLTSKYAKPTVVLIQPVTNDLFAGTSGNDCYNYVSSLAAKVKADGGIPIVETCLPATRLSTAQEQERVTFNSKVTATASTTFRVADVAGDSTVGPKAAASDTSLYPDGLHPNERAYGFIAPIVQAAINSAFA